MSTQTLPVIADVEITIDSDGRYNLNALHKASGYDPNKAPAQWLRTQQAQEFVKEVTDMQICTSPIHASKGGKEQGTFAHELLAVEYAGWISPAFRIKVNQTFIDYRTGKLQPKLPRADRERLMLAREAFKTAKLFGFDGNMAVLSADNFVKSVLGQGVLSDMGATHFIADAKGLTYSPTELGKLCEPPMTARQVNLALERAGLQKKELDHWLPTDAAVGDFEWVDTGKKHSSGAPVKQIRWFQTALNRIEIVA